MFYHPNDNRFTIIIKHLVAFAALCSLFAVMVYAIFDEAQIPQKEITLVIDVEDRVNICLPQDGELDEKSFFNF